MKTSPICRRFSESTNQGYLRLIAHDDFRLKTEIPCVQPVSNVISHDAVPALLLPTCNLLRHPIQQLDEIPFRLEL